ncbi:hypothetical protein J437_LFUL010815 [Ladona fulva]|uniref:Uncharacterized protein n=1 Tax=Ladona fulva TaxID=123851 RepID=A0A8K0KAR8_LADFU|nr:hypothetical protein J437_LFUL010815 [Ladona fulva]
MVDPSNCRTGKNTFPITYPDLSLSIAPVPHYHEFSMSTPLERRQLSLEDSRKSESKDDVADPDENFRGAEKRNPYYPNRKYLDLIRDIGLTESNAELLTSRLNQWNLLDEIAKVNVHRKRHHNCSSIFTRQEGLCFCHNVAGLLKAIGNQNHQ